MTLIAVLADDLTSALDGAAPFAARGLSVRVVLRASAITPGSADVLAVDLDSRFLRPGVAQRRFHGAAQRLRSAALVYKTVDSTLRGNLGAEAQGALAGAGRQRAEVAPAFPAAGRTTVQGLQRVQGMPLEHTVFASDPRTPVTTSNVAERMHGLPPDGMRVHDATHDHDLDAIVAAVGWQRPGVLWVGSPGLAAALARALPAMPIPGTQGRPAAVAGRLPAAPAPRPCRRVLVVVGSLHPANQAQVDGLAHAGVPVIGLPVDTGSPFDPAPLAARVAQALARHPVVCLASPRMADAATGTPACAAPALQLAQLVVRCAPHFDALVATGGDTARRMVDALRARSLDLLGEVEPGVPFGMLRLQGRQIPFSTKAGGFGSADTLLRCVQLLQSLPTHSPQQRPTP